MSRSAVRNPTPRQPVVVHIERLVLDGMGYTAAHGALVQRALEAELTRLIADRPAAADWIVGALPRVPANEVRVDAAMRPSQLGRDVAQSVFATLRSSP